VLDADTPLTPVCTHTSSMAQEMRAYKAHLEDDLKKLHKTAVRKSNPIFVDGGIRVSFSYIGLSPDATAPTSVSCSYNMNEQQKDGVFCFVRRFDIAPLHVGAFVCCHVGAVVLFCCAFPLRYRVLVRQEQ